MKGRPDQTRPNQTKPEQTKPDKVRARPNQTRPDQTRSAKNKHKGKLYHPQKICQFTGLFSKPDSGWVFFFNKNLSIHWLIFETRFLGDFPVGEFFFNKKFVNSLAYFQNPVFLQSEFFFKKKCQFIIFGTHPQINRVD